MKQLIAILLALAALANVYAQVSYGADLGAKSKYTVRGAIYDSNPVVWPDVWVSAKEYTLTIFANVPTKTLDASGARSTEVDYMVDYKKAVESTTYGYGAYLYTYPGEAPLTCAEATASVTQDVAGHLLLGASGFMDTRNFAYGYLTPSAKLYGSYKAFTAKAGMSVGFGTVGLQDVASSLELLYNPPKLSNLTVTLDGHHSWMPYANAPEGQIHNFMWFGGNIGLAF